MPESQRDLFRLIWYRNNDLLLKFLAVDNKICTYGTFKWLVPSSPPFAMSGDVVWGICFSQLAVDVATD